jgi:hypothetical protein
MLNSDSWLGVIRRVGMVDPMPLHHDLIRPIWDPPNGGAWVQASLGDTELRALGSCPIAFQVMASL